MKKLIMISIILVSFCTVNGQSIKNLGAGYFGNTVSYPGIVIQYELEHSYTSKASLPLQISTGFYIHPRYNTGIFADVKYGFRRYFKSGLFLEEAIGAGVLTTFINSDEVYQVDQEGNVSEASRYAATDFMPSLTLGVGYNLSKDPEKRSLIWMRPALFWQYPHKTSSMYSGSLSIGYTRSL